MRSAVVFVALGTTALLAQEQRRADVPEPCRDPHWVRLFTAQRIALKAAGEVDVLFVGDSLTAHWTSTGAPVWELEFGHLNRVNFGISADRTEHILFRLWKGGIAESRPKVAVVLAGTNNLAATPPDSPEQVAAAVVKIAEVIRRMSPRTRVLVVSILPSGITAGSLLRQRIIETNALIAGRMAELGPEVRYADVHDRFFDAAGSWRIGLTTDGTHLSLQGYDVLGRGISKELGRFDEE